MSINIKELKIGDKVRYLGGDERECGDFLSEGKVYEIVGEDRNGDLFFERDNGGRWFVLNYNKHNFEKVAEESRTKPEVGDLVVFNEDNLDVTKGKEYRIDSVSYLCDQITFIDDARDVHSWSYPSEDYTLIKRKSEQELIANLAQEVAELKNQLAELKADVGEYKTKNDVNIMATAFDLEAIKHRLKEGV